MQSKPPVKCGPRFCGSTARTTGNIGLWLGMGLRFCARQRLHLNPLYDLQMHKSAVRILPVVYRITSNLRNTTKTYLFQLLFANWTLPIGTLYFRNFIKCRSSMYLAMCHLNQYFCNNNNNPSCVGMHGWWYMHCRQPMTPRGVKIRT